MVIDGFEHQLLDEGGNAAVADHAQLIGGFRAGPGPAGADDVEPEASLAFFQRIGGKAAADRRAGGRAVREIEAAVVLRAFDDAAFDEPVGEVGVAVGADAVGGVEFSLLVTDEGVGFLAMVEADDVGRTQIGGGTDFQPAFGVGFRLRRIAVSSDRALGAGSGRFT